MSTAPGACERLAQSRERLRQTLHDVQRLPAGTDNPGTGTPTTPEINLLLRFFQVWQAKQPLREALLLLSIAAKAQLQQTAQRHPYGLVTGAAALGGLFILTRPWRWGSTPGLLMGLLPQLVSEVIKRMPVRHAPNQA